MADATVVLWRRAADQRLHRVGADGRPACGCGAAWQDGDGYPRRCEACEALRRGKEARRDDRN